MTRQTMYLRMITSSLIRRRSRMLVALLAVAIGATVLSGLVTIYYDVPRQMGQEFRSYGANLILTSSAANSFGMEELEQARSLLPKDSLVGLSAYRYETVQINHNPFLVGGTDFEQVKKTSPYWLVNGELPAERKQILLGQNAASLLNVRTGNTVEVIGKDVYGNDIRKSFFISGILQTGGSEEECLYIFMQDLEEITKIDGVIDVAECSIRASASELELIAERIKTNVPNINARLVKQVTQSEGIVLKKLQSLVWIVTLVILVLTMVCVATTMMAVVAERRKEIGLRKALGAANKDIIREFLGEGLFLGGLGGIFGVILGFIFAQFVSINVFARTISFQPLLIPVTIIISVAITGLACMIPVRSATEVDPAIVLRGE